MPRATSPETYRKLLERESGFRSLIERSAEVIQLMSAEGRVLYSSDAVTQVMGYQVEEVLGADPRDFIHPDDVPVYLAKLGELMRQPGGSARVEIRVRHKDGHYLWIDLMGVNHLHNSAVRALVGSFRDISKRKEMEQALAESEARLRFMAESMPQKIFTVNPAGKIDYFNPQWIEYTGMPAEQIERETFKKFIHPTDFPENARLWRLALKTGQPFIYEHRFRRKDGAYRWHLTHVQCMRAPDGSVVMWIGSSTDIDDVKRAEKRQAMLEHKAKTLQEQRQQLLELNKAKDEFISLASHQLRTPATGVKQYLGMVLEGIIDKSGVPPEVLKILQVAYESNERQLKIVNDLLKVAYVDAGHLKLEKADCNVDELVHSVIEELHDVVHGRSQKVIYANKATGTTVRADCRLLRMVIENLVDNASKYSPAGSKITVSVQRAAGFLCINVTDKGVGISRADQVRLFKKFSRIENPLSTQVGGTGLGLYWAHQVISLHRGSIMVRSVLGKGSTFSVQLPLR